MPATDVGKAPDERDDLAKIIRAKPRRTESRDTTRTRPHNAVQLRIGAHVELFFHRRHQLLHDDSRIVVVGRIVFCPAVRRAVTPIPRGGLRLVRSPSRIDEYTEHHRNFPPIDQIVQDVLRLHAAGLGHHRLPIVENHYRRRLRRIILGGYINIVGVLGARKHLRGNHLGRGKRPLRHPVHRQRVRPEFIERIHLRIHCRPTGPRGFRRTGSGHGRRRGGRLREAGQREQQAQQGGIERGLHGVGGSEKKIEKLTGDVAPSPEARVKKITVHFLKPDSLPLPRTAALLRSVRPSPLTTTLLSP